MILFVSIVTSLGAQNKEYVYTEASDLNLIGKIHKDTPNPYHRVDTVKYKGFTRGENDQVRSSAGLAVLFKTNSSSISLKPEYGYMNNSSSTMGIALRGYDLYIKKDNGCSPLPRLHQAKSLTRISYSSATCQKAKKSACSIFLSTANFILWA